MKHSLTKLCLLLALLGGGAFTLHAQSSAFTYQGRLTSSGSPANGSHDFQFTLFGAESGGNPKGGPLTVPAVGVTNGLFTVPLDFDAAVFNGADRWLDIAVRPAGSGTFTPLNPRQPITPTPYAVTALNVPGISGSSLNSANGGPLNVVVVDNFGKVGVGTTSPQETLDVRSGDGSYVRVDSVNGDIKVNGGSDGHFGIFNDGPSSGGTHLIGQGQSRFFVANTGRVGIGTTVPRAKLDVRGDVMLGPTGQLSAIGGEENLRIVRGKVFPKGQIVAGSGFTVSHDDGSRVYEIHFTTPFATPPTVTATVERSSHSAYPITFFITESQFSISFQSAWEEIETTFHFIAIGSR